MEALSLALVLIVFMEDFVNTVLFHFHFTVSVFFKPFNLIPDYYYFLNEKNIMHVNQVHVKMEQDVMFQMVETLSLVHASMDILVNSVKTVILFFLFSLFDFIVLVRSKFNPYKNQSKNSTQSM